MQPWKNPCLCAAVIVGLLLSAFQESAAAEIQGSIENPNSVHGKGTNYKLIGATTFGWRTGTISGDLDLNGQSFMMDTGGGNYTVFSGAITGRGSFVWRSGGVPQVAPSILNGDKPNSFQGTFTLSKGVLDLNKPEGTTAISGDLIIGSEADALVRLSQSHQISDTTQVTLGGKGLAAIDLQSHDERFQSLTLQTHATISFGEKPASLVIGECHDRTWDLTKTLTIHRFKTGTDLLRFGENERALLPAQIARIGFANPAGLPAGLYAATINSNGSVSPSTIVRATNPPFDVSAKAIAERAKLYDVAGLTQLTAKDNPLPDQTTISFFGDSITWQNGFIGEIAKTLQASEGTQKKNVRLINRGINGGGVLQIRDGATSGGFPGNSAQASFEKLLVEDKSNVAVVFIGINDVWWRKTSADDFEMALRDLAATAKRHQVQLVLATLTVRGELPDGKNSDDPKIEQFAQITRDVAVNTKATLVDLRSAYIAWLQNNNAQLRIDGSLYSVPSGHLTYDGVHPSSKGVQLLANLIADGIVRSLAEQRRGS